MKISVILHLHTFCINLSILSFSIFVAAILTDRKEVEKWLKKFPNLNVADIKENPHALPGGSLFKLYKEKHKSLAKDNRKTALAFHGTPEANIDSICQNGYNAGLRSGQAHGPGEYFATTPDISFGYCRGIELLLTPITPPHPAPMFIVNILSVQLSCRGEEDVS